MAPVNPLSTRPPIGTSIPAGGGSTPPAGSPPRGPSRLGGNAALDGLRALDRPRTVPRSHTPPGTIVPDRRFGTLVGPGKRTEPLQPHETQQAAYQLGAKLNGGGFDVSAAGRKNEDGSTTVEYADPQRERQRLADATQTMHDTRLALNHGRSNVHGESSATPQGNVPRVDTSCDMNMWGGPSAGAGAALHLGAGNCDQNGWVNTRMHAPKLQPDETINTLTSHGAHHTFSEVHTAPQPGKPAAPPVVLDSWSSGPAVRREDSRWAHADTVGGKPWESFDRMSGEAERNQMLAHKANFQNGTWTEANDSLKINQAKPRPPRMFTDTPVVGPEFAAQAQAALRPHGDKDPLGRQIMAAGAARDAYNLSVSQAVKQETIVGVGVQAVFLERMSRPPVERPPE